MTELLTPDELAALLKLKRRTVIIEPSQAKAHPTGGTHASPRLHDRRGHLRRLRGGKNVWVRPCKVGDASLGAVFHDYEVAA